MSSLKELAVAVVDDLNAQSFILPFTAEFSRRPLETLPRLEADLRVYVGPVSQSTIVENRAQGMDSYNVQILIESRIVSTRTEEQLASLGSEVYNLYRNRHLPNGGAIEYYWVEVAQDFVYDYDELDENAVYQTVISLSYKVWQSW